MGAGGPKPPMKEIDETRAAGREDAFEEIVKRIKATGTEVEDEITPLYTEVGEEEFEIGEKRIVTFNLNKEDFELTRKIETHMLQGAGHQKHLEESDTPRITTILRKKSQYESNWRSVDLEDMF